MPRRTTHILLRATPTLVLVIALASSCSRWNADAVAVARQGAGLELRLSLDRASYRPGEMVRCTVHLVNAGDRRLVVALPHVAPLERDSNIRFFARDVEAPSVVRCRPVLPERGLEPKASELEPAQTVSGTFAFVGLTARSGAYRFQAHFSPMFLSAGSAGSPAIISPPIEVLVEGERLCRRDENGLLVEAEAVELAKSEYARPVRAATAVLARNKSSGLLDWWVTLEKMPRDVGRDGRTRVAYYVDPYACAVRAEAPPYDEPDDGAGARIPRP